MARWIPMPQPSPLAGEGGPQPALSPARAWPGEGFRIVSVLPKRPTLTSLSKIGVHCSAFIIQYSSFTSRGQPEHHAVAVSAAVRGGTVQVACRVWIKPA